METTQINSEVINHAINGMVNINEGTEPKEVESYYTRELNKIKTNGTYPPTFKMVTDSDSTKNLSLNNQSAKDLINWLKKEFSL